MLFWSSYGVVDKIESIMMAGKNRMPLVVASFKGGRPVSLTIDYTGLR